MAFQTTGLVSKAKKIIEAVIRDKGIEPDEHRVSASDGAAAWALAVGSAAVMIALNPSRSSREATQPKRDRRASRAGAPTRGTPYTLRRPRARAGRSTAHPLD